MTETVEVPSLGIGPEQTRLWIGVLYAAGQALQRTRAAAADRAAAERSAPEGGAEAGRDDRRSEQRVDPAGGSPRNDGGRGGFDRGPAGGHGREPGADAGQYSGKETVIARVLAEALPAAVWDKVRAGDRYGRLVEDLHERVQRGEQIGPLLLLDERQAQKVFDARDPAAYLAAVVRRAAACVVVDVDLDAAPGPEVTTAEHVDRGHHDGAAVHANTAAAETARAAGHEHDAAADRGTPDDADTAVREDLVAASAARTDDALAATARTAAGTEHAAAAAARAALTPDAGLHVVARGQAGPALRAALKSQQPGRRGPVRTAHTAPRRPGRAASR